MWPHFHSGGPAAATAAAATAALAKINAGVESLPTKAHLGVFIPRSLVSALSTFLSLMYEQNLERNRVLNGRLCAPSWRSSSRTAQLMAGDSVHRV